MTKFHGTPCPFSDAQMAEMRDLWDNRPELSAKAIGERLGATKSQVIGYAHRREWAERRSPPRPPSDVVTVDLFPPSGRCVFPHGHPGQDGFHFCGEPVARVGLPYCPTHIAKAYQPAPVKQRQAAE
jgi:hypothetical protein